MRRLHLTVFWALAAATGWALVPHADPPLAPAPEPPPPAPPLQEHLLGDLRVRVSLDRPSLVDGAERYLLVEVETLDLPRPDRPVDLALVLDNSGSMEGERLLAVRDAARGILDELGQGDTVSVVAFRHVPTTLARRAHPFGDLYRELGTLYAWGATDMGAGLAAGFEGLPEGGRVVLLTDGEPTEGITDTAALAAMVGARAEQGRSLSALGLGSDFDSGLLAALADEGGGSYRYVSSSRHVGDLFRDELHRLRTVVARGVTVDITSEALWVAEAYGYDAWDGGPIPRGWSAYLGDLSQGDERKVVARVVVQAGMNPGEVTVRSDQGELRIPLALSWAEPGQAIGVDERVARRVLRARTGDILDEHARLVRAEQREQAVAVREEGRRVLKGLEEEFGVRAPELEVLDEVRSDHYEQLLALGYME